MDGLSIPPLLLYAFGAVIAIMGGLRAYFLGWKQRPDIPEEMEDADEPPLSPPRPVPTPGASTEDQDDDAELRGEVRGSTNRSWSDGKPTAKHKRHVAMGLLWVAMGLFLIISTALNR